MSSLLSLYFLHPFSNRLANKTQRYNPRYELTNPTKTPPPPFVFSLLSVILLHLYYTLHPPLLYFPSLSPSVTTPRSHVTLSPLPLLLLPVPLLLCLLIPCYSPSFLCYPVSSPSVTTLCSHVTLSPLTLSLLSSSSVTTLCSFVTLSSFYPVSPPCRVKNVYLSYPQGPLLCPRQGLSSMQNMPFLPLEDALLACRTCPSWRHVFKSLIVRSLR